MGVEHAGDAVKPIPVDMEFIEPIAAVREQKMQDFGFTVVENA